MCGCFRNSWGGWWNESRWRAELSEIDSRFHISAGIPVVTPALRSGLRTRFPSELSDEAFWKIIEDFSEDGGTFTSENFSSNELGYQTLIPKLQAFVKPGSVYMGVGPEQNFQYIAGLKPKMAFIIDIRRQNMIQHLMYKAAFEMSANRADFLSIIFSRKRPEGLSETSTPDQLFEAYRGSEGCRLWPKPIGRRSKIS